MFSFIEEILTKDIDDIKVKKYTLFSLVYLLQNERFNILDNLMKMGIAEIVYKYVNNKDKLLIKGALRAMSSLIYKSEIFTQVRFIYLGLI